MSDTEYIFTISTKRENTTIPNKQIANAMISQTKKIKTFFHNQLKKSRKGNLVLFISTLK